MRILIVKPKMAKFVPRAGECDGRILLIASHLTNKGHKVEIVDEHNNKAEKYIINKIKISSITIIVLDHSYIRGERLFECIKKIDIWQEYSNKRFVLCGFISTMFKEEIVEYMENKPVFAGDRRVGNEDPICRELESFYRGESIRNGEAALNIKFIRQEKCSIFPIVGSIGCSNKCAFCVYNVSHPNRWIARPSGAIVSDMMRVCSSTGIRNYCFVDNNFSGSVDEVERKEYIARLTKAIIKNDMNLRFSANVDLGLLDIKSLERLCRAGLKSIVTGLEAFNEQTRARRYGKRNDIENIYRNSLFLEKKGVKVLYSIILFHPYSTLKEIRDEIIEIYERSNWRIAQLLVNSRLKIYPGTSIEKQMQESGMLVRNRFDPDFTFNDNDVGFVYNKLKKWNLEYDTKEGAIRNVFKVCDKSFYEWLSIRKIREQEFLYRMLL